MADRIIVYWRDIPAQVIVKAGRKSAKRELPKRFIETIDRVAMRQGLVGTDDYLEQWRRGTSTPCGEDLEAEVNLAVEALESAYPSERLKELSDCGGLETHVESPN